MIQKMPEGVDSKFRLALLVARRAEQLMRGARPKIETDRPVKPTRLAAQEFDQNLIRWDFGPEGFRLVGGRWQPLTDGTPVTYTWFHGRTGGVICMMRQTEAFNPPPGPREVHQGILFYRYRGFSLCLINIGGYGTFISVIGTRLPMRQFVPLVLRTIH